MKTLDQISVGHNCVVKKVKGVASFRRRLFDMGLTPNAKIFVRKKAPLGDPIEINLRGYELSLRKDECKVIFVEEI